MLTIIRAVRALPHPGAVAVVGVGSVAETGDRQEPVHWGRVGDPLRVSQFDEYGQRGVAGDKGCGPTVSAMALAPPAITAAVCSVERTRVSNSRRSGGRVA